MKENEKRAADCLETFLCGRFNVTWQRGANPPDFVFTVNGEKWAVEETQLHQYIRRGKKAESTQAIEEPLAKMCERIKSRAKPPTNRDYLIVAMGPVDDKPLTEIEEAAIDHIQSGKLENKRLAESVGLEVMDGAGKIVDAIGVRGNIKAADGEAIAADIRANLKFALDWILGDKLSTLEKLHDFKRRILLITSVYVFAEPSTVKDILDTCSIKASQCDAVLLLDNSGNVSLLADPGCLFTQALY